MEFLQVYGDIRALDNLLNGSEPDRRVGVEAGPGGQACLIGSTFVYEVMKAGGFGKIDAAILKSGGNYLQYGLSGIPQRAVEIFRNILPDRGFYRPSRLLNSTPPINYPVLEDAVREVPVNLARLAKSGVDLRVVATDVRTGKSKFFAPSDVSDIREAGLASGFPPLLTGEPGFRLYGNLYMDAELGRANSLEFMISEMGVDDVVLISSGLLVPQKPRIPKFASNYLREHFPGYGEAFYEGLEEQAEWFNKSLPYWTGEKKIPGVRIAAIAPSRKMLEVWTMDHRVLEQVHSLTTNSARRLIAELTTADLPLP